MKRVLLFFLIGAIPINATLLVPGNQPQPSPFTFTVTVTSKAYNCATGTLYLGLIPDSTTDTGAFAISKAKRTFGSQEPSFVGIAGSNASSQQIEFLTLAACDGDSNPLLGVVTAFDDFSGPILFQQTQVIAQNTLTGSNNKSEISEDLFDAGIPAMFPDPAMAPAQTSGIVQLVANQCFLIPVLRPQQNFGTLVDFGNPGSGVGLVSIIQDCKKTDHDNPDITLLIRDAVTGSMGNRAIPLDASSQVLKGTQPAGANVMFPDPMNMRDANRVAGYWDDPLQRFYLGFRITTTAGNNNIAKSIVVGRVDCLLGNRLQLQAITPDSAITPGGIANEIVVARNEATSLTVKHIRVLHASTGPSYLIINGGKGETQNVGNLIFALPLVDLDDCDNPFQGTLANKNASLQDFRFITRATANGQLPVATDEFAMVGAGPLPLQPDMDIADIVVAGDTVYVSIANPLCTTNDTGILYSQAMFGPDGKIIRWTPWTKRAFPAVPFTNCIDHGVQFFAVDAVNAKVWAVDGITKRIVRITNWDRGNCCNNLVTLLNQELCCGSTSFLDLDQSTRGFFDLSLTTTSTFHRYALFGGPDTVVFARVSQAFTNAINSPQIVVDDFCCPKNFLETELPEPGGCPIVLEYARQLSGTQTNYFFAGTENGLFVFGQNNGIGFDVQNLNFLNKPPFSESSWHFIKTINGSIIDIKTSGNTLYIITQESTCINPLISKVVRIDFQPTLDQMFDPSNIITIAQSSVGSFTDASFFKAIGIISTSSQPGATEQIVLATNAGLFRTARVGGVQNTIDQIDSGWQLVDTDDMDFFNGIKNIDNASIAISPPTTIWPFNIADNEHACMQFTRGIIHQLNGMQDTEPFNFVPERFISKEFCDCQFQTLDQIFHFWSDGNRRLFIQSCLNACWCRNKILSLPFNTCKWQIKDPCFQFLFDPLLDITKYFSWVSHIGITGILMAGTNDGVIALE